MAQRLQLVLETTGGWWCKRCATVTQLVQHSDVNLWLVDKRLLSKVQLPNSHPSLVVFGAGAPPMEIGVNPYIDVTAAPLPGIAERLRPFL